MLFLFDIYIYVCAHIYILSYMCVNMLLYVLYSITCCVIGCLPHYTVFQAVCFCYDVFVLFCSGITTCTWNANTMKQEHVPKRYLPFTQCHPRILATSCWLVHLTIFSTRLTICSQPVNSALVVVMSPTKAQPRAKIHLSRRSMISNT